MSIYFNPQNGSFKRAVNSNVYVDKTNLLSIFNKVLFTEDNCIALSHARRFGKSQVAGMIDAYYSKGSNSKELFSKFQIAKSESFEKYLNKFNVIHIDISSFYDCYNENIVDKIKESIIEEAKLEYKDINYNIAFHQILNQIYEASHIPFVIIIDEWDCIIRESNDKSLVHKYLQFLHSIFKSEESKSFLALAYITGILPIKKIENESALNNFKEYTMLSSKMLTPYFGFTEEETKKLCEEYDMDYEKMKQWYDGYTIDGISMYNPNSVSEAIFNHKFESYWRNTSSFKTINKYIALEFDGIKEDVIKMLNGERILVDVGKFQNDLHEIHSKDDALTALIHLGYLGYDAENCETMIPNYEVKTAFELAITTDVERWGKISKTIDDCEKLLRATIDGKEELVSEMIDNAHQAYTSILKYNDENSLACTLNMAYFTAPAYYTIIRECPAGKGYADMVLIPQKNINKPAMVVELKKTVATDTAIEQIKNKNYPQALKNYKGDILLVGINYDDKTKKHSCKIEKL